MGLYTLTKLLKVVHVFGDGHFREVKQFAHMRVYSQRFVVGQLSFGTCRQATDGTYRLPLQIAAQVFEFVHVGLR